MKIGITGTHSIGKTTLALKLASFLKKRDPGRNVCLLPELVRFCPFPVNQNGSYHSQMWVYHRQIIAEIEFNKHADILICDRTVLDGLVYARWSGLNNMVDIHMPQAKQWLETYQRIYWLRPEKNKSIIDDGFRDTGHEFQTDIDNIFKKMISELKIKVHEV